MFDIVKVKIKSVYGYSPEVWLFIMAMDRFERESRESKIIIGK